MGKDMRRHLIKSLLHATNDKQGVAAIEYGLIAALIAIVIITAVTLVGTNLSGIFNTIASSVTIKDGQ
jgi:pilus assembly protein Flp/PilA